MQTEIRPYRTNGNDNHSEVKTNFVRNFCTMFFTSLEQDEDYKRVCQISEKLRTKSSEFLVKALKSAISFDFVARQENKYQVFLKFKLNTIKDSFANGLDGVVVAEARKRPDGSSPLRLISEMHEISGDLAWSFMLDAETNIISFIKPQVRRRSDANKRLAEMVVETLDKLKRPTEKHRGEFHNEK